MVLWSTMAFWMTWTSKTTKSNSAVRATDLQVLPSQADVADLEVAKRNSFKAKY